ncbi:MAG TPA: M23 family metallopeptidase [Verrucomicrobiae bacterium]|nr:M23 family metallopeptidase [Verrucomicrobiae bacterium]
MRRKLLRSKPVFFGTLIAICAIGAFVARAAHSNLPDSEGAVSTDTTNVKVTSRRVGDATQFYVENSERTEVTMTFDFSTKNLKSDVQFPYTATFLPGETEAFSLSPEKPDAQWSYAYTNYYKLGSSVAVPDNYIYHLPYAPGTAHRVTQGYDGKFSHQGSNKYAIDWKMPEGTPVLAARGGLVVKVKDDSDIGGGSMKYDRYNNYVLIRHDDGTLGHYCHLQKGGVKVHPGERVVAGQEIALSGCTGFSTGPHLHFCVFKTRNGRQRESIPVQFLNEENQPITIAEGRSYRAPKFPVTQTAMANHSEMVAR